MKKTILFLITFLSFTFIVNAQNTGFTGNMEIRGSLEVKNGWGDSTALIRIVPTDSTKVLIIIGGDTDSTTIYIASDSVSIPTMFTCDSIYTLAAAAWADFVFEKEYLLLPLDEQKAFVFDNKHLPSLDPAPEPGSYVNPYGQLPGIVEEVEKLNLYIFQLEARIKELENNKRRRIFKCLRK